MFGKLSRSWYFAKLSYGTIWNNKSLLLFPIVSALASIVVLASFAGGVWASGLVEWVETVDGTQAHLANEAVGYAIAFLFYFVSYFVIVFFNVGLTACALQAVQGESTSVGCGISAATKRLPQIAGWAAVSALIGLILRMIENAHEKAGEFIAMIVGSAWTALTFFVVPALVVEGVGPIEAIKSSGRTLKKTWGEALVGNFSLGLISTLIMLPLLIGFFALGFVVAGMNNPTLLFVVIGAGVLTLMLAGVFASAADVVFKALLYSYATGKALPAGVDGGRFEDAFRHKKSK
jgi:hypothetical protein